MSHRQRARRAALAAAFTTVLVVTLNPPAALADTGQPSIIPGGRNSGDPHTGVCNLRENGVEKSYMCMYTSSDLNLTNAGFYPMDTTYVYSLDVTNGMNVNPAVASNWVDRATEGGRGPAFVEDDLPKSKGAKHLWAPTMHYGNLTRETFLYVPDIDPSITVPGISEDGHPSYIAVANTYWADSTQANPWGPFKYKKNITYLGADINPWLAQSFPDGELPYMSDPAVTTVNLAGRGATTLLLWANGDYNNGAHHAKCGSISVGQLDDNDYTNLVSTPWRVGSQVHIDGIVPALGECAPGVGHPYLEGPELYDLTQVNVPLPLHPTTGQTQPYALFFAAKPEFNPAGSNNSNQVLAWATASHPLGPYTYRGVLMDGSETSWTNHGSIYATTIDDGPDADTTPDVRFLLFFHDESNTATPHNRKARALCMMYDKSDRSFLKVTRQPIGMTTVPSLHTCQGFQD